MFRSCCISLSTFLALLLFSPALLRADSCLPSLAGNIPTSLAGGSNYISFGNIRHYLDSLQCDSEKCRFDPDRLRPVIAAYHLNPETVNRQLTTMARSGQKLVSFPLWFASVRGKETSKGFERHFVYSNGGTLQPQQLANLRNIARQVRSLKFETFIIRFIPQSWNTPYGWKEFDEKLFLEDWMFIQSTIALLKKELDGSSVKLLVDLGGEQGGSEKGQNRAYVQRLWHKFCAQYPDCGRFAYFSINPVPPAVQRRISNLYLWTAATGSPMPDIYAVDVYGYGGGIKKPVMDWDIYTQLADVHSELKKIGQNDKLILIQETFYNDLKTAQDIKRFADSHPVRIMAIVQWPNTRKTYDKYFSLKITNFASEDFPSDYCRYLPSPAKTPASLPNP